MTTLLHKFSQRLASIIGILPMLVIVGAFTLAIRAYYYLGYWPTPSRPDPKILPFDVHLGFVWVIFDLFLWSVVVLPALYLMNSKVLGKPLKRAPINHYGIGWILVLALIYLPKVNVVSWFLD